MKNLKKILGKTLCGLALTLLMAGCVDLLQAPAAPETRPGTVTLSVNGGPARTVAPSVEQFEKITLVIAGQEPTADLPDVDASSGSVTVEFPVEGSWKITAKAYLGAEDTEPVAASVEHPFSWDGSTVTGDTFFVLVPTGTGDGTLKYTITVPGTVTLAASGSRIQLEQDGSALDDLDIDGFTDGVHDISDSEEDITVELPAGYYMADIMLENNAGNTAVYRESVVILPGLVTNLSFEPDAEDFLDPDVRAAMTDLTDIEFDTTALTGGNVEIGSLTPSGSGYTLAIDADVETETVYFTLTKTASHSVAISGTDSALVTTLEMAEGSEAGPDLAVFAVDISGIAVDDTKTFTITVAEEGKIGVLVEVTITGTSTSPPGPGPGLYIDSGIGGTEDLTLLDAAGTDLQGILTYLAASAVNNTKYVVLVNQDSEMTSLFSSKSGSTGVRITLRGIGVERKIYSHTSPTASNHYFVINTGTTLALGQNITLGGSPGSPLELPTNIGWIRANSSGRLEMLAGSKISNTTTDKMSLIDIYGAFEMWNGAAIKDNSVFDVVPVSYVIPQRVQREEVAAISISDTGTFTMHGGEISGTNYRGVHLKENSANASFAMEGGVIKNNGNSAMTWNDVDYYPRGGGVFVSYPCTFTMTGGEISNNGHSSTPGSGIFADSDGQDKFVLSGQITINNNTIAFTGDSGYFVYPSIGHNFSTENHIAVDLCISDTTTSNFSSWWLGEQFLWSTSSNGATIDAALAEKFAPVKCYVAMIAPSNLTNTDVSDIIRYKIGDDGKVAE